MGGRQSMDQTTRETINSHSEDIATSSPAQTAETHQFHPRQMCTREHRELRTRSLMLSEMHGGSQNMSTVDTGLVMLSSPSTAAASSSTTGSTIPTLDRFLRLGSIDIPSTSTRTPNRTVWLRPFHYRLFDIKCPVCHKIVPSDDVELHLVVCLTKPKLTYNEDILVEVNKGECIICFDDMIPGDVIARLPCLCCYHKTCIDSWFKVKNSCPEHPGDD